VNLPNAITVARIAASPLIAWLPFAPNWGSRLTAFVLYLAAAITDYWDGHLARTRNLVTDLGRLLDPLADKLLLVATFVPMLWLMGARRRSCSPRRGGAPAVRVRHAARLRDDAVVGGRRGARARARDDDLPASTRRGAGS
jgi:hypothetical protein